MRVVDMKGKPLPLRLIILIACCLIVAVAAAILLMPRKEINDFKSCKDAGGAILESYPERCMIDKKSFTNKEQSVAGDVSGYIGLLEQAALNRAVAEGQSARVIERDGESLAVTMDFIPGRLNFIVKEGKVDRVQVEGEEK
jgi:hypothetical protein